MLSINQLAQKFSNEQILMIVISRIYFNTISKKETQDFINHNEIDWQQFYRIISVHSIRSFIYTIIINENIVIDNTVLEKLKEDLKTISLKNLHQLNYLNSIVNDLLNKTGSIVIPYKGVAFAATYYKSISQRESVDLDFFVDKKDVIKIKDYFQNNSFNSNATVPDDYIQYMIKNFRDITFQTRKDSLKINSGIEIHWELIPKNILQFPDFNFFSLHLEKSKKENELILKLPPTYDLLIIITNHFIKEQLTSFKYLIDIACILKEKGSEIKWETLIEISQKFHFKKINTACFNTLNDLIGYNVQSFKNETIIIRNDTLIINALSYPIKLDRKTPVSYFQYLKCVYYYQDTLREKVNLILKTLKSLFIPNITDINTFKLSKKYLFVLYILRPFRLTMKFIGSKH